MVHIIADLQLVVNYGNAAVRMDGGKNKSDYAGVVLLSSSAERDMRYSSA